jgi:hypothetical protein
VISGEQIIEQSEHKRGGTNNQQKTTSSKKTHIEVLDDERPIQQYIGNNKQQYQEEDYINEGEAQSESGDLLKKLMENLHGNPALQNVHVQEQFKLHGIREETDLHNYKNLLNSMAALFYTNHRMNDVTLLFYMWRDAAAKKMAANQSNAKSNNTNNKSGSKESRQAAPSAKQGK